MNTTLTTAAVTALVAAGINLEETFPGGLTIVPDNAAAIPAETVTPAVTQPKADGRNKAARAHNYERRMDRRANTALGGVTKVERRLLAAILRDELGREFTKDEWADNMAAYKAGEFTLADI